MASQSSSGVFAVGTPPVDVLIVLAVLLPTLTGVSVVLGVWLVERGFWLLAGSCAGLAGCFLAEAALSMILLARAIR